MVYCHSVNSETELQVAERLVREAVTDIARQKRIIQELRRDGRVDVGANILLGLFEKGLKGYQQARDSLRAKSTWNRS